MVQPVPVDPFPELPSRALPEPLEEQIIFSRTVRVTVGQILEVPFRGTGWVYLGELGGRRGISYDSRRLDIQPGRRYDSEAVEGQSFIFRVESAGTYILRFYRQDFIQDYIINDYVQVIAGERGENSGRVAAERVIAEPRWPPDPGTVVEPLPRTTPEVPVAESPVVPAAPVPAITAPASAAQQFPPPVSLGQPEPAASPQTPAMVEPVTTSPQAPPPVDSPAEYVRRARQEFDSGRIESALGILDNMRQFYPGGTDESLLLNAQLLEANSPSRDIRSSLEYYRRLVNEFPFSDHVEEAQRRIAYLERFYFNIR